MDPPFAVVTAQVTAVFVLFVTVAVNDAVCGGHGTGTHVGQPANTVAPEGLTLMPTGGVLLLPQATSSPMSTSRAQRPTIAEYFDIFHPAKPTITTPASGNASGNHGERLSALR
jgi:hypothetical protein